MSDLVVDTDVVSYGFRQDARFINRYGPAIEGKRLIVSFMTVAELLVGSLHRGWGERRRNELQEYLDRHYVRYGVTERICGAWAELIWSEKQQGRVLSGSNAWIAATAMTLNLPLVTHNTRHFAHITPLRLITFPDQ